MKGLALLMAAAKPKGKGDSPMGESSEDESPESSSGGSEESYAKEVFSALQDGDEAGFTSALKGFVKACKSNSYDSEE